jgi:hypothetical protein
MVRWTVSDLNEKNWREYGHGLRCHLGVCEELLRKTTKNLRKNNRSAGLNSNRALPKVNKHTNIPYGKAVIMSDISAGGWRNKTKPSTSRCHYYTTFIHDV